MTVSDASAADSSFEVTAANGRAARFVGDIYVLGEGSSPWNSQGGGIVIEPFNGTAGGGADNVPYARLIFNPEKRSLSAVVQGDVIMSAHKYHSSGALHEHFSIYTSNAGGTATKRLDLEYLQDQAAWSWTNCLLEGNFDNTTGLSLSFVHGPRNSNAAIGSVFYFENNPIVSDGGSYTVANNTVSIIVSKTQTSGTITQNSVGLRVSNAGNGRSIYVTHDDTGSNPTLDIDRAGNNASKIWGVKLEVDNAGAGGVGAIDLSSFSAGETVFKFVADATDPTGGGGAAVGRIAVEIGGATRYLPYY